MTAPKEREEWMLPRMDVLRIEDRNYDANEIGTMIYQTGLRAKLHELEAVLSDCPEINDAGQSLTFDFIRTRIEEIRRELE